MIGRSLLQVIALDVAKLMADDGGHVFLVIAKLRKHWCVHDEHHLSLAIVADVCVG